MRELLQVRNLETRFQTQEGTVHAVNGVSFNLQAGETLGIVGESGSGKTVTVMSLLGLIPSPPGKVVAGQALFLGQDLLQMPQAQLRRLLGSQISIVFQDPMTSFNPVHTIGWQVVEPLTIHKGMSRREAWKVGIELLNLVGIPKAAERMNDYPHQFSGGMRQRVMIAMALVCSPVLLIADEPTTALDVTIQAQILELVKRLRTELEMSMIWITHDLGIIAGLAHRVLVMYGGQIVEETPVERLYTHPQHPYTIALLESLPRVDETSHRRLNAIEGMPPVFMEKPGFCPFAPRCRFSIERCWQENPPLLQVGPDQFAACWVNPDTGEER
jgi:oligopeptide transport system ATP-binding protein